MKFSYSNLFKLKMIILVFGIPAFYRVAKSRIVQEAVSGKMYCREKRGHCDLAEKICRLVRNKLSRIAVRCLLHAAAIFKLLNKIAVIEGRKPKKALRQNFAMKKIKN
jgi:hypothetical protein